MKQLLAEKYRPKTIDDYIFMTDDVEEKVKQWVGEKEIPNVLLTGIQGTGKSSLAWILINALEVDKSDIKYAAASMIKPMEFFREELEPWLKRAPISRCKIVYLEEMDRFKEDAQKALRTLTENYSDRVRFIGTANHTSQIGPPLQSRFQHIEVKSLPRDQIIDMIIGIIEKEDIKVDDENILLAHLEYAPDIRKIINSIDESTIKGTLKLPLGNGGSVDIDRWEIIWKEGTAAENLSELLDLTEYVDQNNFEWFYEVMYSNHHNFPSPRDGIIAISKYLDRALRCANQRIHLDAFLYEVFEVGAESE